MNVYSAAAKIVGAATAGLVLYDAHKNGTIKGTMDSKLNTANSMVDHYIQSNIMEKSSTVEMNAKKGFFRFVMDNNLRESINATCGYVSGFLSSCVTDIIPAALATVAMLSNNKIGKFCGLGLVAYGAKYLLYDIMTVGKRDYLKETV